MNKNNTDTKHNPTKHNPTKHNPTKNKQTEHKQTEHNPNNNEFRVPPVGSYIPKKTPEQIQMDLLKSFGYGNNEGQQK